MSKPKHKGKGVKSSVDIGALPKTVSKPKRKGKGVKSSVDYGALFDGSSRPNSTPYVGGNPTISATKAPSMIDALPPSLSTPVSSGKAEKDEVGSQASNKAESIVISDSSCDSDSDSSSDGDLDRKALKEYSQISDELRNASKAGFKNRLNLVNKYFLDTGEPYKPYECCLKS